MDPDIIIRKFSENTYVTEAYDLDTVVLESKDTADFVSILATNFKQSMNTNVQWTTYNLNPTDTAIVAGKVLWDASSGMLAIGRDDGLSVMRLNEGVQTPVKFIESVSIGTPVYLISQDGDFPTVGKALGSDVAKSKVIGFASENCAINTVGHMCSVGTIRNVASSVFATGQVLSAGDKLYLSTDGKLANSRPSSGENRYVVAVVLSTSNNTILCNATYNADALDLLDARIDNIYDNIGDRMEEGEARLATIEGEIDALDTRLDILEGEGEGSVAKAIGDAVNHLAEVVDTNRLYSDQQYIELKAKADALQVKCNTLQAEVYTDAPILQYGATEIIGKGYEADATPIDVSANVGDGKLNMEQKGLTITNLVNGASIANLGTVTFTTVLNDKYYDTLNNAILTGTGSDMTATNNSGATANLAIYHLNALGLDHITDTDILAQLLPYVDGTKSVGKMGVKVVGKNILPPNYFINGYRLLNNGNVIYDNNYIGIYSASPVYIPVVPNSHYTINRRDANRVCAFYDRNRNFIGLPSVFYGYTGLTPANCYYIRIGFNSLASQQEDLHMVRTLTQTGVESMPPYEPYQEQLTFLPSIGNSLPNGVADSIKTVADGWEHTKRVERYVLQASDMDELATSTTNSDRIIMHSFLSDANKTDWLFNRLCTSVAVEGFRARAYLDDAVSVGTFYGYLNKDIVLCVPKGIYTTLAEAQAALAGTVIYYQLATPILTHYDLPHLTSGKTIHRFAGEEKIALYSTGLTFSENVLSILSAVKFVAGVMTDITSLATITGATVTFSGVSATDVVYVKVEHSVNRPLGILEHTPAVSNTASRLASLEARVSALEV